MNNRRKVNSKYLFLGTIALLIYILTLSNTAVAYDETNICKYLTNVEGAALAKAKINLGTLEGIRSSTRTDTLKPLPKDTLKPLSRDTIKSLLEDTIKPPSNDTALKDSLSIADTTKPILDSFHFKLSKDTLEGIVKYEASDSIVFDVKSSKVYMYGKANAAYQDINLTADHIVIDQPTQIVSASFTTDTSGNPVGVPNLIQGEQNFTADSIAYNFKTQRGYTKYTHTQQGEMFVAGKTIKKVNTTDYYIEGATITTCNFDHPHFAFSAAKMKLVNKKLAVTGPIHPVIEGIPIKMVTIPFGFFPLSKGGRQSGILAPTFTTNEQFGLGLEGLGYYKVLNDYFDATILGNIYSYGGWSFNVQPTYRKRYRYQGGMTFRMQNFKMNFKGDPDYTKSRTFNLTWNHSVDAKARPGQSFSASVNAGSTKFNQYIPNNSFANYNNNLNSSISYSKNWDGKVNLTVNANHSQNANTREVQLNLPDIGFTVNPFYPFQKREMTGQPKWYEKFGIGLTTNARSRVTFYDSAVSVRQILDTFQYGVSNSIPITLPLPPIGPIQISPSVTYDERWYGQEFIRKWNPVTNKVDTTINKGLYSARQMSYGLGFNTAVFGVANFKNSRVVALRHVMRPSISANYRPDFQRGNYDSVQINSTGRKYHLSKYDGSIFGPFGAGEFGGMSFGLDNNLEAKIRSRKDTGENAIKKVKLIDGFGINGSYNFLAESFKLSNLSMYMRSTLFDKLNITANANLDPYQLDAEGFRVDKLAWEGKRFSLSNLGRITGGSISASTQFSSKPKDGKTKEDIPVEEDLGPLTLEEQQLQLDYARRNPAEFADFNIAWSLNLSFSLSFQRIFKTDYSGFETMINSSLNVGGDFNITPKWKAGANGFYDIKTSEIQSLTMFITREMHCWQMSINVTPIGMYRSFNITINPKSGLLRDLKINRTRYFYTNPGF